MIFVKKFIKSKILHTLFKSFGGPGTFGVLFAFVPFADVPVLLVFDVNMLLLDVLEVNEFIFELVVELIELKWCGEKSISIFVQT